MPTSRYAKTYPMFLSVSDFPSGFAYIAASLKKAGHEVIGLNLNNITGYASSGAMITAKIREALVEKPDLIGTGGLCIDYHFLKDAMSVFRAEAPDTPVVMGGGIINNDAEFISDLFKPDYAIVGEGEQAMVALADGGVSRQAIPQIIKSEPFANIDDLPFPDWEAFGIKDMLDGFSQATRCLYRYTRPYPKPMIIVTARSCPFNCTFCVHDHGSKYRAHSVGRIMDEIGAMYEQYKFNILIIQDELFAANKKRMDEFCHALIKEREDKGWDFDWMMQTHANANLDKESMELAKRAGCYMFSYGIESASPRILKSMNKKTKVSQIIRAIELAKEVGIGFGGNLLFGDPEENEDTIYESLDFLARYGRASFVFLAPLMPYPGSAIFNGCMDREIIKDKLEYYEHIDGKLFNMTAMSNSEWQNHLSFLTILEKTWLMVDQADATKWEDDTGDDAIAKYVNGKIYKVWAECPYCGEEIMYRQIMQGIPAEQPRLFLGVGCTKCNKKIRVNVNG